MKIAMILVACLIVFVFIILAIGWTLPVKHSASRTLRLKSPVSRVWMAISDFKNATSWRKDLKSIEQIEIFPGVFAWKEIDQGGDVITYTTLEAIPEQRLVRKIADKNLPFGGSWTFEITTDGAETILTITENGEVYNPFFRLLSKFVFGHHATIDKYFSNLHKYLES